MITLIVIDLSSLPSTTQVMTASVPLSSKKSIPLTTPSALIVATDGVSDLHVTVLGIVPIGIVAHFNVICAPFSR